MAKFNEYPAKTTLKDADKFMLYSAEDAANKLIDYDKLADAVLNKLTSKTFGLDAGTMTLPAALNQLNSNLFFVACIKKGTIFKIILSDYKNDMLILGVQSLHLYSNGYLTAIKENADFAKVEISKDYLNVTITINTNEVFTLGILTFNPVKVERIAP